MFNIKQLVKKALVNIAQEKIGRPLSAEEIEEIDDSVDETEGVSDSDEPKYDAEISTILQEDAIESLAGDIRQVVVGYVELMNNLYPFSIKRDLPILKECHTRILNAEHNLLEESILYAEQDIFDNEFQLLDNVEEYRSFFKEYTADPSKFELKSIISLVPDKYKAEVEELFVSLPAAESNRC